MLDVPGEERTTVPAGEANVSSEGPHEDAETTRGAHLRRTLRTEDGVLWQSFAAWLEPEGSVIIRRTAAGDRNSIAIKLTPEERAWLKENV